MEKANVDEKESKKNKQRKQGSQSTTRGPHQTSDGTTKKYDIAFFL